MLDAILADQIDWMVALQTLTRWLVAAAGAITRLGNEEFYLFVAPILYWCFNTRTGLRVGIYLMLSGGVNYALKIFFAQPRPYWIDPRISAFHTESSFGLPSGHAQNAAVFWGSFAASARHPAIILLAGLLIFFIGASRIILGVHFISDVVLGWLTGGLLLYIFLRLEKPLISWLKRQEVTRQILLIFSGSLFLVGMGVLARVIQSEWEMPAEWLANAIAAYPTAAAPDPMALSGLITNAGAFFGLAIGALWTDRRGGFDPGGLAWKRLARFGLGVIGVAFLWFGLGAIFPRGESLLPYGLRYLRYTLIGLWVTGMAPWLFVRFKLANLGAPQE